VADASMGFAEDDRRFERAQTRQSSGPNRDPRVALLAALLLVGSVVGAIVELYADGLSLSLVFGLVVSLLFWYWIAMGAWRQTSWSSRR
jgi:uncharacterized membrane protein